jgi:hypothetical protein
LSSLPVSEFVAIRPERIIPEIAALWGSIAISREMFVKCTNCRNPVPGPMVLLARVVFTECDDCNRDSLMVRILRRGVRCDVGSQWGMREMLRLELDQPTEDRVADIFKYLVIMGALATLPLTAAYWFEWDHWAFTVGDWIVWGIFASEYAFYLSISSDRWRTTKNMWLSVAIVIFSFPLMHHILQSTRLIRLARPVPLLRQGMLLRQFELLQLSSMRSAGTKTGWQTAKEKLGDDHWITRWMVYLERLKAWIIEFVIDRFRRKSTGDDQSN